MTDCPKIYWRPNCRTSTIGDSELNFTNKANKEDDMIIVIVYLEIIPQIWW